MFSLIITALVVLVILFNLKTLTLHMVALVSSKTEVEEKSRIVRIHGFSIPCALRLAFSYGVLASIAGLAGATLALPTIAATVGILTIVGLLVNLYAKKAAIPRGQVSVILEFEKMMADFDEQMTEERRNAEASVA